MAGVFEPLGNVFSGGLSILKFWWIFAVLAVIGIIIAVVWWIKKYKNKNGQWTHKLFVNIEMPSGEIDPKAIIFNMRRWKHPDEKTPPLFELEKPLIGSRIFVELEEYSGPTAYEVVLGKDGRLYIPTKTTMNKDKNALEVSVKHAGIDRARQGYNNRFEQMNATASRIDALTLMKYGLYASGIIVILILGIVGLKAWGERASYDAAAAQAELQSWEMMAESQEATLSALNAVTLILPDLKEMYGNNIQSAIRSQKDKLEES